MFDAGGLCEKDGHYGAGFVDKKEEFHGGPEVVIDGGV